jgi:hypothetical protein
MGHMKIVVDHDRFEYNGPFDANDLFRMISNFIFEKGFDFKQDKDFEINKPHGKFIEWEISPWKRVTDYVRYIIRVRIVGYDIVKTDANTGRKKTKIDSGRLVITMDGMVEYDYDYYWDDKPILHFLRTIYDKFVFKAYTERFEQRLVHDVNHLHDNIEKLLNLHRHYTTRSRGL